MSPCTVSLRLKRTSYWEEWGCAPRGVATSSMINVLPRGLHQNANITLKISDEHPGDSLITQKFQRSQKRQCC